MCSTCFEKRDSSQLRDAVHCTSSFEEGDGSRIVAFELSGYRLRLPLLDVLTIPSAVCSGSALHRELNIQRAATRLVGRC